VVRTSGANYINVLGGSAVQSLLGAPLGYNLGGASVPSSTVFPDNTFRVFDDVDSTKQLALQTSGITTATTRTVTAQNSDGTMALIAGADKAIQFNNNGVSGGNATEFSYDTTLKSVGIATPGTADASLEIGANGNRQYGFRFSDTTNTNASAEIYGISSRLSSATAGATRGISSTPTNTKASGSASTGFYTLPTGGAATFLRGTHVVLRGSLVQYGLDVDALGTGGVTDTTQGVKAVASIGTNVIGGSFTTALGTNCTAVQALATGAGTNNIGVDARASAGVTNIAIKSTGKAQYSATGDMGTNNEAFASKLYVDTKVSAVDYARFSQIDELTFDNFVALQGSTKLSGHSTGIQFSNAMPYDCRTTGTITKISGIIGRSCVDAGSISAPVMVNMVVYKLASNGLSFTSIGTIQIPLIGGVTVGTSNTLAVTNLNYIVTTSIAVSLGEKLALGFDSITGSANASRIADSLFTLTIE
jgi:hypothetical protein